MLTIHFFKGLPGSGKSTEALRMVREGNGAYVRVNKDDLRAMLHAGHFSKGNEDQVLRIRDQIMRDALLNGKHVIVDDTNFEPKHRAAVEAIAEEVRSAKGTCVVKERFFDTPLEDCIARDLKRQNSVGEKVIRTMYNKHLRPAKPEIAPLVQDAALPRAVIVDIDGTLAKMHERGPFEWQKVGQDRPHEDIIALVHALKPTHTIIFMSGRDEVCRSATVAWLDFHLRHIPAPELLLMRPAGNMEKDAVIKERLFRDHIYGKYHVDYVIDDRDQVVRMWRDLGLRCLQVADGDF
jgi:predicted kinase